jgi:hypothetical protein
MDSGEVAKNAPIKRVFALQIHLFTFVALAVQVLSPASDSEL